MYFKFDCIKEVLISKVRFWFLWNQFWISITLLILPPFLFQCSDIRRPPFESLLFLQTSAGNVGMITSDFGGGGRYNVLNFRDRFLLPGLTPVHSDAVVRYYQNRVYIVNRLGRDSIQILNSELANLTMREFSVGSGTNPHDIVVLNPGKAYVSRYNAKSILIVNPLTGGILGEIDLSSYAENSSSSGIPDGIPEMSWMVQFRERVFVTLQRLDRNDASGFFPPSGTSYLLELDPVTDLPLQAYTFQSTNPFCKPQVVTLFGDPYIVTCTPGFLGFLSMIDGGVEAFNLRTNQFRPGFLLEESQVGGDILDVQIANEELGFVSVLDAKFNKKIVSFNPSTRRILQTLFEVPATVGTNFSGMLMTRDGFLILGIRDFSSPGIQIYDTRGGLRNFTPVPIRTEITPFDFTELVD